MKVKFILSVLAVSFLTLTSCKKDYDCNCSLSGFSADGEKYYDVKKSDAESRCSDHESDLKQFNSSISCTVVEAD